MLFDFLNKGAKLAIYVSAAAFVGFTGMESHAATLSAGFTYDYTNNVLIDGNTGGLSWLNLAETTNKSYNTVSGEFGIGGDFEGYRYATGAEVNVMIGHWVGSVLTNHKNYHAEPFIDDLISYLGPTIPTPDRTNYSFGITKDTMPQSPYFHYTAALLDYPDHLNILDVSELLFAANNDDWFYPTTGSFLVSTSVSAVPLPAAFPLYGAGVAMMGFIGWRRKRRNARN